MASPVRAVLNPHRRGDDAELLLRGLQERIVGQRPALERIVDTYQTLLAGLHSRRRPLANFLFLGPTGSGKTHTVEALADVLFRNPRALIKVDCGEFQHSHEIAKLVGSPPGYLGHRETHPVFTQEALDEFRTPGHDLSLVLFDEIEKASDSLWQLLLGVLDKAVLTLGDNRKVDFTHTMIFLSSNLGAREMQDLMVPGCGFAPAMVGGGECDRRRESAAVEAARRRFSPEFFNRLDHVVVFHPLEDTQLEQVLDLELDAVRARLLSRAAAGAGPVSFSCTPQARQMLLSCGTDPKYGARHLKRAIERELVHPLATLIATRQVSATDCIAVDYDGNSLVFTREPALVRTRIAA